MNTVSKETAKLLMDKKIWPDYSQILICDPDHISFPEWKTGEEEFVVEGTTLLLAVQEDKEGEVQVLVYEGMPKDELLTDDREIYRQTWHLINNSISIQELLGQEDRIKLNNSIITISIYGNNLDRYHSIIKIFLT